MSWQVSAEQDPILPEGLYETVVQDLEKIETAFGQRVMWSFHIPNEDATVPGFSSLSPSLKAKGAQWARAILGTDDRSFTWGPEELKGKPCLVYVEISADADGNERNLVTKVLPSRKRQAS